MRRWVPDGNAWRFRGQNGTQQQIDCARLSVVNKQVDIPCDGSLGRDFLERTGANVCYESRTVTLNRETTCKMVDKAKELEARKSNMRSIGQIKLTPRA